MDLIDFLSFSYVMFGVFVFVVLAVLLQSMCQESPYLFLSSEEEESFYQLVWLQAKNELDDWLHDHFLPSPEEERLRLIELGAYQTYLNYSQRHDEAGVRRRLREIEALQPS